MIWSLKSRFSKWKGNQHPKIKTTINKEIRAVCNSSLCFCKDKKEFEFLKDLKLELHLEFLKNSTVAFFDTKIETHQHELISRQNSSSYT